MLLSPAHHHEDIPNYEQLIMEIGAYCLRKSNGKVQSMRGYKIHGDTGIELVTLGNQHIGLRIWEQHMYSSNENIQRSQSGDIFISASLKGFSESGIPEEKHLPLYGWYKNDDFESIWSAISKI